MENCKQLSNRLKECRAGRRLSQKEVASYCNISEHTYQNYELMTRQPKLEIIKRIANLFDVSIDYLVGITDDKNRH